MTQEIQAAQPPESPQSLQVINGETYLPAKPVVTPGSREFNDLLMRCLPENTAEEVAAHFDPARQKWSRAQSMAAGLFVIAGAVLIWYFFPGTPPAPREMLPISLKTETAAAPAITRQSPYRELYDSAQKLLAQKQYAECVRFLNDAAKTILAERKDNSNDRVLKLYFNAAYQGNLPPELRSDVRARLAEIKAASPDDPMWHFLDLEFNDAKNITPETLLEEIRKSGKNGLGEKIAEARLRQLKKTEEKIGALRHTIKNLPEEKDRTDWLEKADLYTAKMLLCRWILEGGRGKEILPDDNLNDPGVASREEALKILLRHGNEKEFQKLRLFLAETIQAHLTGIDGFYWNSEKQYWRENLKKEISDIKKALQNVEK